MYRQTSEKRKHEPTTPNWGTKKTLSGNVVARLNYYLEKDSLKGANMIKYLGVMYAWTGEKELALQQIAATLAISADLGYGQLRLHSYWDSLCGDPGQRREYAI